MRTLEDLLSWLEYGRDSGYVAAREPKEQEEHWADLLREKLASHTALIEALKEALKSILPAMRNQPEPQVGDWNWPAMVEQAEVTLAMGGSGTRCTRCGCVFGPEGGTGTGVCSACVEEAQEAAP